MTGETTRANLDATAIALGVVEHGRARLIAAAWLPEALTRNHRVSRLHEPMPFAEAVRTGDCVRDPPRPSTSPTTSSAPSRRARGSTTWPSSSSSERGDDSRRPQAW
ncbi:hypothetical protein NGB36_17670 [Streptomyces sp. RB6PN25]|uniref:Uncharacterized protein n=1 Tax=Streptomyces humicola TaxID=2953240 RepID=A0ABT1PXH4_9ACTN|nr:hypothetical protein [Streptomyces humicola]MCQ4082378.1 hypothetical protein [Streptomyces humicola]